MNACQCRWWKHFDADWWACVYCGTLLSKEPLTLVPREDAKPPYDPATKTIIYWVVVEHRDSVLGWLKESASWDTITQRLKKRTGRKLCQKTVVKYFEKIMETM